MIKQVKNNQQAAVFLDRDGVINYDHEYVHKAHDFIFMTDVFETCKRFTESGYQIIIITNQSGIARGYYTEKDFDLLNQWMLEQFRINGIDITAVYYCPHHPVNGLGKYKTECNCRKPKPGMILQAADEHQINLSKSILIGDNLSDIQAGKSAGLAKNYLVKTGKKEVIDSSNSADRIFDNLTSVVNHISL
jgi:D-glycero-D-manno-heptose 1,7-bisphosphate phosphatase